MVMGTQLFLAGFIAEMVARNAPFRNDYVIEKRLNHSDFLDNDHLNFDGAVKFSRLLQREVVANITPGCSRLDP